MGLEGVREAARRKSTMLAVELEYAVSPAYDYLLAFHRDQFWHHQLFMMGILEHRV